MEILDGTIVATAAPAIAADLGVAPVDVNAVLTGYLVALAAGTSISGWLAARFGSRRVFLTGVAIFTLASGLCAASPDLAAMVVSRILQGLGGALMVPVGRLVVLRSTARAELLPAIAYLTWPGLVAPVIAPSLGGWIVTAASWHWIFLINLPLGALAFIAAVRVVPPFSEPTVAPLDRRGFILTAGALVSVLVGLELIRPAGNPALAGVSLAVGALFLVAGVRWFRRAPNPLLDFTALRLASFRAGNVGGSVYRMVISAVPFLIPLLFQVGFGWSAAQAGLLLMALFVGNVGIKPLTTPVIRRYGFRTVLLVGVGGGLIALLALAWLGPDTPVPVIAAVLVVSGALRSVGFSAYNSLQFADVADAHLSGANVVSATMQQVATALGVSVAALLLRLGEVAADGPTDLVAYRVAFWALAALMIIPLAGAVRLPATAGHQVTGRRP